MLAPAGGNMGGGEPNAEAANGGVAIGLGGGAFDGECTGVHEDTGVGGVAIGDGRADSGRGAAVGSPENMRVNSPDAALGGGVAGADGGLAGGDVGGLYGAGGGVIAPPAAPNMRVKSPAAGGGATMGAEGGVSTGGVITGGVKIGGVNTGGGTAFAGRCSVVGAAPIGPPNIIVNEPASAAGGCGGSCGAGAGACGAGACGAGACGAGACGAGGCGAGGGTAVIGAAAIGVLNNAVNEPGASPAGAGGAATAGTIGGATSWTIGASGGGAAGGIVAPPLRSASQPTNDVIVVTNSVTIAKPAGIVAVSNTRFLSAPVRRASCARNCSTASGPAASAR